VGWQITACLYLLVVLTASVANKEGGGNLQSLEQSCPRSIRIRRRRPDYCERGCCSHASIPLACFDDELSCSRISEENRAASDVYITRVYKPVWTNPDGFSWRRCCRSRERSACTSRGFTPTWSETAGSPTTSADGPGTERHEPPPPTMSRNPRCAGIGFRQPVLRVARRQRGETVNATYEANPGEVVGGKAKFWARSPWADFDPTGFARRIRKYFESRMSVARPPCDRPRAQN